MTTSNPFSAADSALGYLYQVRAGLLWALRRLKMNDDFLISLETLDDVTFETKGGTPSPFCSDRVSAECAQEKSTKRTPGGTESALASFTMFSRAMLRSPRSTPPT